MEPINRSLLTFLLNSLWQIPLAAAVAAMVCRLMRNGPAIHRHAVWVAALAAALLLPLASIRSEAPRRSPQFAVPLPTPDFAGVKAGAPLPTRPAAASKTADSRTIAFARSTAGVVVGLYVLFLLFRFAQLGWASLRTVQIRRRAVAIPLPERLEVVRTRCERAFGLGRVDLLFSNRISGPITAAGAIILPESLLVAASENVLTTAIGHEMAHIARRDFACNLLYELLHLPVSFHPAAWLIRRGVERTREMTCDDLVTYRLLEPGVYAQSIMTIAAGMTALPRPGYTLGVFDGDILEERIRRLIAQPGRNLKRARLMLVTGLSALAFCAVIASSLALTARAQSAAHGVMKLAEAAYNRGDYQQATGLFQNAVQLEPQNLKAKLLLANTLLQQYTPGSAAGRPLADRARQQYLDALALDPRSVQALDGMVSLFTNMRQFAEAHDWAMKGIQADATDKGAYYSAGFLDWVIAYPDFSKARAAAGTSPQEIGAIPDAELRLKVRTDHMGQIEEGLRMLEIAVQLDPDYSPAMAYMNLLCRMKAGVVDDATESTELLAKADTWFAKAREAQARAARRPQRTESALDIDGPLPEFRSGQLLAPPPPPPPPPPGFGQLASSGDRHAAWMERNSPPDTISGDSKSELQAFKVVPPPPPPPPPPDWHNDLSRIVVEGSVQQAKLVRQEAPVYPPAARQMNLGGVVELAVVIATDGTVKKVDFVDEHLSKMAFGFGDMSGKPVLGGAAADAVRQWVYQPTLLNGNPVEVSTTVRVTFSPAGQ